MSATVSTNPAAADIDDAAPISASIAFEVWWDTLPQLQQEMMAAHARACFVAGFASGSHRLEAKRLPGVEMHEIVEPSETWRFGFDVGGLTLTGRRIGAGSVSLVLEVSDSAPANTASVMMDAILKHLSREFDDIRAKGAFA